MLSNFTPQAHKLQICQNLQFFFLIIAIDVCVLTHVHGSIVPEY